MQMHRNFSLVISAKVGGNEALDVVRFHWRPSNNHAPQFLEPDQAIEIGYVRAGDTIGHIEAYDPDEGEFGRVSYKIISGRFSSLLQHLFSNQTLGNEQDAFVLDSTTGEIRLKKRSDELLASDFKLTVRAIDNATTPRSTTNVIRIRRIVNREDKEALATLE